MTTAEWLTCARINRAILTSLVANYHPASLAHPADKLPITAPAAERIRQRVSNSIRESGRESDISPAKQLERAIDNGDLKTIARILDQTWYGVPESTNCWEIPGFRQAVDLIYNLNEL